MCKNCAPDEGAANDEKTNKCTIVTAYDSELLASDLKTLRSTSWLNDEVINFYIQLLED
jgi:Ulp1 family protease